MTFARRTFAATVTGLALMASLPSVSMAQGQTDTAPIRQTLQRYEQALNRSDTAAIVALYTPDGVQMAPDAPAAVGREGVRAAYDATFKAIALNLRFTVDDIQLVGKDAAVLRSHSTGTLKVQGADAAAVPANFKELFVLRQQADGQWKFSHYSFSATPARP